MYRQAGVLVVDRQIGSDHSDHENYAGGLKFFRIFRIMSIMKSDAVYLSNHAAIEGAGVLCMVSYIYIAKDEGHCRSLSLTVAVSGTHSPAVASPCFRSHL